MIYFLNGNFMSEDEIHISPEDRGFMFADGIYEVIRAYKGKLFRGMSHIERMMYGARELRLPVSDFQDLLEVSRDLIRKNDLIETDSITYIQVTRGAAPRTHEFPSSETPKTVFAYAKEYAANLDLIENGINIILVPDQRWARCDIKSINLLANTLARQKAKEKNAGEALFVRDGFVLEGTHSNLFMVKSNSIYTPPKTNYILDGITRNVVMEICEKLGIPCIEKSIPENEIENADELMITGTTTEITPIVKINDKPFRSNKPGPLTRKIQGAFANLIRV